MNIESMCDAGQELHQWRAAICSVVSAIPQPFPDFRVDWGRNIEAHTKTSTKISVTSYHQKISVHYIRVRSLWAEINQLG